MGPYFFNNEFTPRLTRTKTLLWLTLQDPIVLREPKASHSYKIRQHVGNMGGYAEGAWGEGAWTITLELIWVPYSLSMWRSPQVVLIRWSYRYFKTFEPRIIILFWTWGPITYAFVWFPIVEPHPTKYNSNTWAEIPDCEISSQLDKNLPCGASYPLALACRYSVSKLEKQICERSSAALIYLKKKVVEMGWLPWSNVSVCWRNLQGWWGELPIGCEDDGLGQWSGRTGS